jgi:hypothetical protein
MTHFPLAVSSCVERNVADRFVAATVSDGIPNIGDTGQFLDLLKGVTAGEAVLLLMRWPDF